MDPFGCWKTRVWKTQIGALKLNLNNLILKFKTERTCKLSIDPYSETVRQFRKMKILEKFEVMFQ